MDDLIDLVDDTDVSEDYTTSAETSEPSFLDKPFNEYSTQEGLMLLILIVLFLILIRRIFGKD